MWRFVFLCSALGQDLLLKDDQCSESSDACALKALQTHAGKIQHEENQTEVQAASLDAVEAALAQIQKNGKSSKLQRFYCNKDTGGTCSWFGCSKSRNADCKEGKCTCGTNLCAKNGKCGIAEGYRMERTTVKERDTGGSCRFFSCDSSRGPTKCNRTEGYKCLCIDGFFSVKGMCQPKLVKVQPDGSIAHQGQQPQTFDWTKVDWSKIFKNQGWGATTDWSKFDWSKIYGVGVAPAPAPLGSGYGLPYGQPAGGIPYVPPSPYAYANPYGVPYWR